jgi:hypothetical protein
MATGTLGHRKNSTSKSNTDPTRPRPVKLKKVIVRGAEFRAKPKAAQLRDPSLYAKMGRRRPTSNPSPNPTLNLVEVLEAGIR